MKTRAQPKDAGNDPRLAERLKRNPSNPDAKLDAGLDKSMDASDPPAVTAPGRADTPAPSSGYDEEAERQRALKRKA